MFGKHHNISMTERILKRRLKDYGLTRRKELDNGLLDNVRCLISFEIETALAALMDIERCGTYCVLDTTLMFLVAWLN